MEYCTKYPKTRQFELLFEENNKSLEMKISAFLIFKKKEFLCEECENGKMIQIVHPSHGKIVRDKEYLVQDAKEFAKKTVKKIREGDEKTFIDVYGDSPNK